MPESGKQAQHTVSRLKVSARGAVAPFEVMDIVDRVSTLRAQGIDVISLCVGEPGGGAPAAVNAAAAKLHAEGADFGYTPTRGLPETRAALAEHYARQYSVQLPAENIVMTTGSSGAFQLAFLAAFDPGDVVALARPGYPAYANILSALGLQVVDLATGEEQRFQPTVASLEAALAEHSRLDGLVIASPANPTGTMLSGAELAELAHWCQRHGVRLISDEIYHGIEFDPQRPAHTAWEYSRESLVVSSFSKFWGMTGWRLGWMLVPDDLICAVDALASNLALCAPAPAQRAVLHAFSPASMAEARERVTEFAASRELVMQNLARLGFDSAAPADGAFYLYGRLAPRVLERFASASAYCRAVLDEARVALTPGNDFDPATGDRYVRLSFAAGPTAIAQAIERIDGFLTRHGLAG
ncbi:aminotransferase class I/II-fold pyridoxal phosphate-dependent enzyme [Glutamicibacter sp. PS]|uniref:pyridoxal phosphate-dependent aminotransferase n=1 Tax=Glutamicibacter sp. PS TaxID=3075634 RepID=UPI00284C4159|nr:aminotransferase class I/II-fold pyridoxal phosphate-dependent enzyme [Glutamicibacter sp. PS]MDR4534321.1 aminotransferase class I/II-fold pyridoxal phosphate-dependent enzyme [Glutamicibacter sp. PS]